MLHTRIGLAVALLVASAGAALAAADEIQVYTGDIEPLGVAGLTWHNNYTPNGLKTPDFPGALIDNHAYSSVAEWAYGVTPWFEAGLYLPLYADTPAHGLTYNGFKLRALFVQPDNENKPFITASISNSAGTRNTGNPSPTAAKSAPSSAGALVTIIAGVSPSIPSWTMITKAASPDWSSIPLPGSTTGYGQPLPDASRQKI